MKETVKARLHSRVIFFYDEGIQILFYRFDKYLNNGGDNVEK